MSDIESLSDTEESRELIELNSVDVLANLAVIVSNTNKRSHNKHSDYISGSDEDDEQMARVKRLKTEVQ